MRITQGAKIIVLQIKNTEFLDYQKYEFII